MSLLNARDMFRNARMWLAAGPLLCMTSAILTIIFSMRSLSETLAEEEVGLMDQYDATLLALVLLAALGSAAMAVRQAAVRTRRRVANYAIAGLAPSAAASRLTQQVIGIAAICATLGTVLGWVFSPTAIEFIIWATSGRHDLVGRTDAYAIMGAVIITVGLAVIASTRGAQVARSVEPIEALKALPFRPVRTARPGALVGLVAGLGAVICGALTYYLPGLARFYWRPIDAANVGATCASAMAAFLIVALTLTAPLYCPFLIRVWTFFIPERHLPALFLGRRGAAYQAGRSLEAFNVVLVGALLVGSALSIYFSRSALDPAGRGWVEARDVSGVVLAGVPVALALVGSIFVIVATSRDRTMEARVLRLSGATSRQVLVAGFTEAFILAATATAVALAGVAVVGFTTGLGLSRVSTAPDWPVALGFDAAVWIAPLGVTVFGMVLVTAVSLPYLVKGLNHPAA